MKQYCHVPLAQSDAVCVGMKQHIKVARSKSARIQRGFDLVQIAIVVGVIGVLMAAAFMGVPRVMASVRATGEAQDLQAFALAHQEIPATVKIDDDYLLTNNLYPKSQHIEGKPATPPTNGNQGTQAVDEKYLNRFGGDVTFSHASLITKITTTKIPSLACEKLIPIVAGSFQTVSVGGTVVKAANAPLQDPKTYKEKCSAEPQVDISFTLKR